MILIFIETLTFQKTFVALSICSVAERDDIESARRRSLKGPIIILDLRANPCIFVGCHFEYGAEGNRKRSITKPSIFSELHQVTSTISQF